MLTYANMQGLDREHALMLTGALPTLMLNHLQVQHTSVYVEHTWAYVSILMLNHLQSHDSIYRNTPVLSAADVC
jgi:hypothetical protein